MNLIAALGDFKLLIDMNISPGLISFPGAEFSYLLPTKQNLVPIILGATGGLGWDFHH